MCVPPKTWNIAHKPLLVAIYLINRIIYSKEASRPQRKQLLPLVPKEAISKEAISKEAIPKEAIINATTCLCPLPPNDENDRAHNNIKYELQLDLACDVGLDYVQR
jgi:hypothetical protein